MATEKKKKKEDSSSSSSTAPKLQKADSKAGITTEKVKRVKQQVQEQQHDISVNEFSHAPWLFCVRVIPQQQQSQGKHKKQQHQSEEMKKEKEQVHLLTTDFIRNLAREVDPSLVLNSQSNEELLAFADKYLQRRIADIVAPPPPPPSPSVHHASEEEEQQQQQKENRKDEIERMQQSQMPYYRVEISKWESANHAADSIVVDAKAEIIEIKNPEVEKEKARKELEEQKKKEEEEKRNKKEKKKKRK